MKWKNDLYNLEVNPPAEVWNRITHDLDEEFYLFRNKLYHAEVDPPEQVWQHIQNGLDSSPTTVVRVLPVKKILRIAVAAALIGISFFTANYFLSGTGSTKISQQKTSTENNPVEVSPAPHTNDVEEVTVAAKPVKNKPLLASNSAVHRNLKTNASEPLFHDHPTDQNIFEAPSFSLVHDDKTAFSDRYAPGHNAPRHIRNLKGEIREDVRLMDLPNSYFLMTGPNGQSVRVSSKFRNTIQYLNGSDNEEFLDIILRESQYWRSQFKEWKEEVSKSAFTPAAHNFMDITALMKLLQEHNVK